MNNGPAKTIEEAREQLAEACMAISHATDLVRPYLPLLEQFRDEAQIMNSIGPIIDPTAFMNPERRATEAFLKPIFEAAERFVHTVDIQKTRAQAALDQLNKGEAR